MNYIYIRTYVCMYVCMYVYMYVFIYVRMYVYMTKYMYCVYVGFDYTYIDINALAQGIKSFFGLTSLVSSRCRGSNLWHRFARNY